MRSFSDVFRYCLYLGGSVLYTRICLIIYIFTDLARRSWVVVFMCRLLRDLTDGGINCLCFSSGLAITLSAVCHLSIFLGEGEIIRPLPLRLNCFETLNDRFFFNSFPTCSLFWEKYYLNEFFVSLTSTFGFSSSFLLWISFWTESNFKLVKVGLTSSISKIFFKLPDVFLVGLSG